MSTYMHTQARSYTQTCIHTYVCAWIHACITRVHTCIHTYVHTYVHDYIHACRMRDMLWKEMRTRTHFQTYIIYIHAHTHTYIHIHIHTYIHTYADVFIHTHIYTCPSRLCVNDIHAEFTNRPFLLQVRENHTLRREREYQEECLTQMRLPQLILV